MSSTATAEHRRFDAYRAALASRDLRLLLGALAISATGSWAYNVALFAFVYDRTHSFTWVGAAGFVRFLPSVLFSAYGGVIAERTERIRLMVWANVLCAVWQGALVIVAVSSGSPALALLFAALTAATSVVFAPAVTATIPAVVDEDSLVAANALNSTIDNLVVILGPAVGAALLAVGSTAIVFGVNAASFLLAAVLLPLMRTRSRPVDVTEGGSAGPLQQMIVGARTIVSLPAARTLVAFCALVSFVYGTDTVLFVGVSAQRLGTGASGFGYLLAGLGIGGVLMAPFVDRLAGSRNLALIIIGGVAGYTLPTALLTVIHTPAVAVVVEVVRGASTLVVDVLAITALQRAVPREQLARVFGVFFAFVIGAIALGSVVTPIVVNQWGLVTGLWVMAVGPFLVGLGGLPDLLRIDRATVARARLLEPRIALLEGLKLFASASRPLLERLAADAAELRFEPDTAIVTQGEHADRLYVLADGEVRVTIHADGEPDRFIRTMTAPTYFGEIGVLERIPRTATVTAVTECRCDAIDGEALLEALTSAPPSSSLMENARLYLSTTHPQRELQFAADPPHDDVVA